MGSHSTPISKGSGHTHSPFLFNGKDFTDPTYVGPGYWVDWHAETLELRTNEEQKEWIARFRKKISRFPCGNCREHALAYIQANPPEGFVGVEFKGENIGMFIYMNIFHNSVNTRIGKPNVSIEQAYTMYSNMAAACGSTCSMAGEESENKETPKYSLLPEKSETSGTSRVPSYQPPGITGKWVRLETLRGATVRRPTNPHIIPPSASFNPQPLRLVSK